MIITRTPYRISFVGGGTDLRNYYKNSQGKVLSTTIDKYIYVVIKRQVGIVEYKYRINYSTVEICNKINEIKHPIVREALKYKCSDSVFSVAEDTANYYRNTNVKQGKFEFNN